MDVFPQAVSFVNQPELKEAIFKKKKKIKSVKN